MLVGLAGRTPLLAGADQLCFVDIDSMLRRMYGRKKQGVAFGHTKVGGYNVLLRGLNPLVAMISTRQAAPVIAASRLRAGNAGSARGAASMVAQAIDRCRQGLRRHGRDHRPDGVPAVQQSCARPHPSNPTSAESRPTDRDRQINPAPPTTTSTAHQDNDPHESNRSGGRRESHPPAPTDPGVNLSGLFRTLNNGDYAEPRNMPSSPLRVGAVPVQGGCAW